MGGVALHNAPPGQRADALSASTADLGISGSAGPFGLDMIGSHTINYFSPNDPESPDSWTVLASVPGYTANQHHMRGTGSNAGIIAVGNASMDMYPKSTGHWLDERATYWLADGSVHVVPDYTDRGLVWHPVSCEAFDPATGRLFVLAINKAYAQHLLDDPGSEWTGERTENLTLMFEQYATPADFNGDGKINTEDFTAFLNAWNGAQR